MPEQSESLYEAIQPIIFAGGKGSRITQLLFGRPKCLVQIANKPLLQYTLEMLTRANMRHVIAIVLDNELSEIQKAVKTMGLDINIDYLTVPADSELGTAESLRTLLAKESSKPKFQGRDLLLIPCDVVTDVDLRLFVKRFYQKNSTLLCMLTKTNSEKENQMPARKLHNFAEYDYVAFDNQQADRLVLFEPDIAFTDAVPIGKSILENCPHLSLSRSYSDTHIYLIKKWVLNYLEHKKNISSIKTELIPSLVRKQFRRPRASNKDETDKSVFDFIERNCVDEALDELEALDLCSSQSFSNSPRSCYPKSLITCHAHCPQVSHMIRVNNWVAFCEANRIMLKANTVKVERSETVRSHIDGMLGAGSSIGEKCAMKRTIIGAHCKIGNGCKLTSCIVQDGVTIEDGVVLNGCLLCHTAFIGANVEMNNCIVGPGQKIASGSSYTNESINEEEY